ncbi:MAG: UDP-N-acetyl-alpha-D-glucosamine C6 dehydratase [Candidatus Ordinivivax streblomastigis]|uniref:UDP-N-acetyl-alpha-D-glucosamine C6 dehydratase n=1 Tax=Candidatus Ordinivivax streblomastigis TaxID=2540710 RepID=A0A5M8NYZ4_9BACT|nr:MAG: UDP-N-acetyl-alpha-D-glucosamine C6 dehydratase [Candidatus Ordinivivax streblomastigis]
MKNKLKRLLANILSKIANIPYLPRWIVFCIDILIVFVSFTISYFVCFDLIKAPILLSSYLIKMGVSVFVSGFFILLFKIHTDVIRYVGFRDILNIFVSLFCANIVLVIMNIILKHFSLCFMPNIGFFINLLLTFATLVFFKTSIRLLFDYIKVKNYEQHKYVSVLVYGFGASSIDTARLINHSSTMKYRVVGFIATAENSAHKHIFNLPVYSLKDIFTDKKILVRYDAIVINPAEIDRKEKQPLSTQCAKSKKELLSMPSVEDLMKEGTDLKRLRKINIEDLLQRIPIQIDIESIGQLLTGKTLLITGAAGSIGSEIVRQVCRFNVKLLLACDVAESPLHEICLEIHDKYPEIKYKPLIANVRDYDLMKHVFEQYQPDIIYHAAAYKHVPLMEAYPCEAILTNVMGSKNMADLAVEYNADVFVMISTDKAVNPSNVMGASKRIAEMYIQSLSKKLETEHVQKKPRFITTRFGNVLGSNGSVIPRFEQQIKEGGPITITHPDIIRYFMTIPEACRLVLDASNFGKGGEVFVFDMGDPVKIKDMAEEMIRLSGYEPYKDINIVVTGLRPGEKLYEELLYDKEAVKPTHNQKIKIGTVKEYDYENVKADLLNLLDIAKKHDHLAVVRRMKEIVPEFISQNSEFEECDKD